MRLTELLARLGQLHVRYGNPEVLMDDGEGLVDVRAVSYEQIDKDEFVAIILPYEDVTSDGA